jgi:hypothetical protein
MPQGHAFPHEAESPRPSGTLKYHEYPRQINLRRGLFAGIIHIFAIKGLIIDYWDYYSEHNVSFCVKILKGRF